MTATGVRVARLRLHTKPGGSRDGQAAVRALDLPPPIADHVVLMVRRLVVPAGDRRAARELLAAARAAAARPAQGGPIPADCPAVLFADEVEALACLCADLVAGRAAGRWYWPAAVRAAARPGDVIARLWLDEPRWVPGALALLARWSPTLPPRAVGLLSPAQTTAVVARVRAAFGLPSPVRPAVTTTPDSTPDSDRPARQLLDLGLALATGPVPQPKPAPAPEPPTGSPPPRVPPVRVPPARVPPARVPPARTAPVRTARPGTAPPGPAPSSGAVPAAGAPARPEPVIGPDAAERPDPRPGEPPTPGHRPERDRTSPAGGRSWAGTAVTTRYATVLYAVNLMGWLAPDPPIGWGTLETLGRRLTRAHRPDEPPDPLWDTLAALDGRDPGMPAPALPRGAATRARRLLTRHRLSRDVFRRPGTVVVGRTHVDVLLGLDQIDLPARVCGLDRDPGWVPELGRIIAFHFTGGA